MTKLSLGHLWCTTEKFLDVACDSNILPVSFVSLNFWKFSDCHEMDLNFDRIKWPNLLSLMTKLSLKCPVHILVVVHNLQVNSEVIKILRQCFC